MKKVLLLLADGFETYEASVFIDVIGWNLEEGDKNTRLFTCGLHKEVKTSFDQKVIVDYTIDQVNVDDYEALAIPGGFKEYDFYREAFDERFLDLIRAFCKKNKFIATICVAALALGKSGVLSGRKGTTYCSRQNELKEFGVEVENEPIVTDGKIITSWNPSTAISVALLLLEKLTNKQNAYLIRELMGF